MKKADGEIGKVYFAKVSEKIARVRIYAECHYGGWYAVNLATSHDVRIKTAARLRGECAKATA